MAQSNNGELKATYKLPNQNITTNSPFPSGLSWVTAPRSQQDISSNGAIRGPSYIENNNPIQTATVGLYDRDELNPLPSNFNPIPTVPPTYINTGNTNFGDRPVNAPYFLFFGKFASQRISNLEPKYVGHVDVSGVTTDQQPSNIYNIPDYPKDYTLYRGEQLSTNPSAVLKYGSKQIMPTLPAPDSKKIIYDGSSCPVNWRVFEPIRNQVLDWSANGITGGGSGGGSGGGGGTGTGTDLSFNNFFFKQPEMPIDCSCVFVTGSGPQNDKLNITWKKPFNRKSGTSYPQTGNRYFYENALNPVENWLPHFTEFVLDISGGPNNRTFSKDASGNFDHTGAFGLFSANNTEINLEARTTPGTASISANGTNYGTSGITTTIIDNFNPNSNTVNAGGTPNQGTSDIGLGSTYDIVLYYRNESKINTPPNLPTNDLKYNNHNVCLFENVIFGIPGFVAEPDKIVFWDNGQLQNGGRIYLGGIGPDFKDEKNNPPGEGLNLPWDNTSLIKVGYDCSLNIFSNIGANRVQAGESPSGNLAGPYNGINNQSFSVTNFDVNFNLKPTGEPDTMANTKKNWPNGTGTGGTGANTGAASSTNDFIKLADIASAAASAVIMPSASARDHPEYKYEITEYNVTNDTPDKITGALVPNTHPTYSASAPLVKIVPINTRAYCNTMGYTEYNDMMVSVSEIPKTNSKTFLDLFNRTGPSSNPTDTAFAPPSGWTGSYNNYFKARGRPTPPSTAPLNFDDVVFVINSSPSTRLVVKSNNRVFKQLANYGEPLSNPTAQTQDGLVESEGYLGVLSSSARVVTLTNTLTDKYITKVQLSAKVGSGSSFGTNVTDFEAGTLTDTDPNIALIDGYTNVSPPSLSTPTQNKVKNNQGHNYKYTVSAPFDIAQNDSETIYSNKRGYYLGFDISDLEVTLDPYSGNQAGPPFVASEEISSSSTMKYDQYRITLEHSAQKRQASGVSTAPLDEVTKKELTFRLAKKPVNDIDISNNSISITNHKSSGITFTKFFGVNRLPTATTGNSQVLGQGLELIIDFTLDKVDENWMPHPDSTGPDDKIAEAHFVLDPNSNNSSIEEFIFKWNDISGNSNAGGGSSESFQAFIEINEGITAITGSSATVKYSRAVTEASPPRNLFGLYDNKIYYSHNVTFLGEDLEFDSNDYSKAQNKQLLVTSTATEDGQDKFKFGSSNEELFWDYTWPKILGSNTGKLPDTFNTGNKFKYLMELPALRQSYQNVPPVNSVWDSGSPSPQSFDLPSLTGNDTASGAAYTTKYNHTIDLTSGSNTNYINQCMWANNYFVGAPIGNTSSLNNPYINYNTYYEQTKNYSSLATSGYNFRRSFSTSALASGINGGTGTPRTFDFPNIKWILLESDITTPQQTGQSFEIEIFGVNAQTGINGTSTTTVLKLGKDYLLFYCEYKPGAYKVDGNTSQDYSTWLDVLSKSIGSGQGGIKSIQTSTNGVSNGASVGGNEDKPAIVDLQKSAERKYLLIGVPENVKICEVKLSQN